MDSAIRVFVTRGTRSRTKLKVSLPIVVFLVAQALDVVTTHVSLATGSIEVNPIAVRILNQYGEGGLYAFKLAAVLTILLVVGRYVDKYPRLRVAFAFSAAVVVAAVALNSLSVILNLS